MSATALLFPEQPVGAPSLYGKLISDLTKGFEHHLDALHKHPQLINRFGEAIKPFGLTPNVNPLPRGGVSLTATSVRGQDAAALLAAMRAAGFHLGTPTRLPHQFNDGYVMWVVPVHADNLAFSVLHYLPADLA